MCSTVGFQGHSVGSASDSDVYIARWSNTRLRASTEGLMQHHYLVILCSRAFLAFVGVKSGACAALSENHVGSITNA